MSKNADGTDRAPRAPKALENYVLSLRLKFATVARLVSVARGESDASELFGLRPAKPIRPADSVTDAKVWAKYSTEVESFFERENAFLANNAVARIIAEVGTDAMTEATEDHAAALVAYDKAMKDAATDPSRRESPEESPAK